MTTPVQPTTVDQQSADDAAKALRAALTAAGLPLAVDVWQEDGRAGWAIDMWAMTPAEASRLTQIIEAGRVAS